MNIDKEQRQTLITNFSKIKKEALEEKPDKSEIFKWFSNTKVIIESIVLSHELTQATHWLSGNFNFLIQNIRS
jgi:hypothetical protein